MPESSRIQFASRSLADRLRLRQTDTLSTGQLAARDLARYYALIDEARKDVTSRFTPKELDLIAALTHENTNPAYLWADIERAKARFQDHPTIADRVARLHPVNATALVDLLEQRMNHKRKESCEQSH